MTPGSIESPEACFNFCPVICQSNQKTCDMQFNPVDGCQMQTTCIPQDGIHLTSVCNFPGFFQNREFFYNNFFFAENCSQARL